jgi:hypothetical protein
VSSDDNDNGRLFTSSSRRTSFLASLRSTDSKALGSSRSADAAKDLEFRRGGDDGSGSGSGSGGAGGGGGRRGAGDGDDAGQANDGDGDGGKVRYKTYRERVKERQRQRKSGPSSTAVASTTAAPALATTASDKLTGAVRASHSAVALQSTPQRSVEPASITGSASTATLSGQPARSRLAIMDGNEYDREDEGREGPAKPRTHHHHGSHHHGSSISKGVGVSMPAHGASTAVGDDSLAGMKFRVRGKSTGNVGGPGPSANSQLLQPTASSMGKTAPAPAGPAPSCVLLMACATRVVCFIRWALRRRVLWPCRHFRQRARLLWSCFRECPAAAFPPPPPPHIHRPIAFCLHLLCWFLQVNKRAWVCS